MFPGVDLYLADPAQPLTTAGEELDDLDDLSEEGNICRQIPSPWHGIWGVG